QMDDDIGMDESISTEELEKRRLALKMELGSSDESEDEEEEEDDDGINDDSPSDDHHRECDNFEKEGFAQEEVQCPAKRSKLEDLSDDDDFSAQSSGSGPSNADADSDLLKRLPAFVKLLIDFHFKEKANTRVSTADFILPLPRGWVEEVHDSGVPIYMHLESKVATLSRPYGLKREEPLRRHSIPIGSIPCEQQRRMKELRQKSRITLPGTSSEISVPQVELKTMDQLREERLSPDELYEKARETFCIKEIMVSKFKSWKDIRAAKKKELMENSMKEESTVAFDGQTLIITFPAGGLAQGTKIKKIHMVGKTSVALLMEFVQKASIGVIDWQFANVKSAINPYSAICFLKTRKDKDERGEMEKADDGENKRGDACNMVLIGRGSGANKNASKLQAASAALKSLIPGINIDDQNKVCGKYTTEESMEAFDLLAVDDESITKHSKRAGKPLPYALLQECMRVNAAWGASKPEETSERIGHAKHELVMKVGRHEARMTCSSLKEGKQIAAQILLKKLYPMMKTWGSILRLFSSI
ncbi:hypothetical protein PMAYCL1PPCAC_05691, partial [Pristionchus mayeri]